MTGAEPQGIRVGGRLEIMALPGLPIIQAGADLAELVAGGLGRAGIALADGDVLVIVSKAVSRAEGRFVDLTTVTPGDRARAVAAQTGKDARLCELILGESSSVSRSGPGALVVRHRRGFVSADAGIDASNAAPADAEAGSGPWALLLPADPDGSAARDPRGAGGAGGGAHRRRHQRLVRAAVPARDRGGRDRGGGLAPALGPARRGRPLRPRPSADHHGARGPGGGGGRSRSPARPRRAAPPCTCAASPSPPASTPRRTCTGRTIGISTHEQGGRPLRRRRRRPLRPRPLARPPLRPAHRHRQHGGRLPALGAPHLAGRGHRDVHPGGPRARGARLGPRGGVVPRARDGAALRGRGLVPARRPRPCHAPAPHAGPRPRRGAARGHGAPLSRGRRGPPHPADGRRPLPDDDRDARGRHALVPGLVRARARQARGARRPLRGRSAARARRRRRHRGGGRGHLRAVEPVRLDRSHPDAARRPRRDREAPRLRREPHRRRPRGEGPARDDDPGADGRAGARPRRSSGTTGACSRGWSWSAATSTGSRGCASSRATR